MVKVFIEKFENFNKFEKAIQKYQDYHKLLQVKVYLQKNRNWLCQCDWQNPKRFLLKRCLNT